MARAEGATLRDMLRRSARWFPNSEAAVDSTCRYTYAELLDQTRRMAALYHRLGVRKGDRVALLLYPSANHPIALFGAIELGAIPVAVHVRESAPGVAAVLNRLSPRVLVYDGNLADTVDRLRGEVPSITGFIRARSPLTDPAQAVSGPDPLIPDDLARYTMDFEPMPLSEDDPAVIVLSSGTTAVPKGIVHTHRTMMESARGGLYMWQAKPSDAMVNSLTTSFIGWYNLSLPFFNVGAKNIFVPRFDPAGYLQTVQDEGGSVMFLVPTMWRLLFAQGLVARYDLSRVKLAGFAGEPMDPATLKLVREQVSQNLINIYGTTETGSCSGGTIMFTEDMSKPGKLASVGKPLLNADVRTIRPGGSPDDEVPVGELGEVIISGPSVASQVWDDQPTSRRIFRGPWWFSGDMGRLDEDGYLYLEGRIDDMIISGGMNILPTRVEDVLMSHPGVALAAVVGVTDAVWGQRVKAFVTLKDKSVSTEDLDAFVRQSDLAQYQRPREYDLLDDLPRTSTGKVNRRALRELGAPGGARS